MYTVWNVGNICSNILGAKQDFCSKILGMLGANNLGVKQDFCSKILGMLGANILDAKQDFCANILGVKTDLCLNLCIEARLLFKHFGCEVSS